MSAAHRDARAVSSVCVVDGVVSRRPAAPGLGGRDGSVGGSSRVADILLRHQHGGM
jgi:hypothetical protein